MALELNKLTGQVDAMGRTLAGRSDILAERTIQAREILATQPEVSDELKRKIKAARQIDEWRRGAIPLGERLDERSRPGVCPTTYTLIAADGSQIYPDRHSFAAYYLLNTGAIVLRAGTGEAPTVSSIPEIFFQDADLYDEEGWIRTPEYVSAQRNRREIQALADLAEAERAALGGDLSVPIVCMVDGPLLPWMKPDPDHADTINQEIEFFAAQMARLRRAAAIPVGYVDRPDSAYVLRILELINLPIEKITREALRQGPFIQLTDRILFDGLAPNERTGLFEPNSDANDRYRTPLGRRSDRLRLRQHDPARTRQGQRHRPHRSAGLDRVRAGQAGHRPGRHLRQLRADQLPLCAGPRARAGGGGPGGERRSGADAFPDPAAQRADARSLVQSGQQAADRRGKT